MKASIRNPAFLLVLFFVSCASVNKTTTPTTDLLPATALKPFGRAVVNTARQVELIGSASHVGFRFEGSECRIFVSIPSWMHHNYLQYELDGEYQGRLRVSAADSVLFIVPPTGGQHTVWLYKATEAHTGPVFIQNIQAKHVQALQRPAAPLIEFIGYSITCGAAADPSDVPCGTGVYHDQHNAYMAYGPRVARQLGVNYFLSSVSGIGIYRNWNSDGPAMPQVYEKTDMQEKSTVTWNFSSYTPQVVSIALGTNDFSHGDGKGQRLPFDSARFVNAYVDFVQTVQNKYPAAQIVLLSSPMLNGEARLLLQNCLGAVKEVADIRMRGHNPVALFFFQSMQAHGCTGHPDVADHAKMADQLLPFLKRFF